MTSDTDPMPRRRPCPARGRRGHRGTARDKSRPAGVRRPQRRRAPQRKPIIPRTADGGGQAGLARGIAGSCTAAIRHGHAAAYHGVRSPGYLTLTLAGRVVGLFRTLGRIIAWWHVPDLYQLEHQAAADGLLTDHLRIHKQGRETRTARGIDPGCLRRRSRRPRWPAGQPVRALVGVGRCSALVAVPVLARHGRPAGKPIVAAGGPAGRGAGADQDVITRALGALGIAGINRWLRDGRALVFPSPVREDGPGWRAEVDLPYGVTAAMVIDRREQLASGLRRPLGAVWPEPVTTSTPGGSSCGSAARTSPRRSRAPWPLLRAGQADVFRPVPFGTDVRGRSVKVPLVYHNWLIGGDPAAGQDGRRPGAGLRGRAGPAGRDVGARAEGLR